MENMTIPAYSMKSLLMQLLTQLNVILPIHSNLSNMI